MRYQFGQLNASHLAKLSALSVQLYPSASSITSPSSSSLSSSSRTLAWIPKAVCGPCDILVSNIPSQPLPTLQLRERSLSSQIVEQSWNTVVYTLYHARCFAWTLRTPPEQLSPETIQSCILCTVTQQHEILLGSNAVGTAIWYQQPLLCVFSTFATFAILGRRRFAYMYLRLVASQTSSRPSLSRPTYWFVVTRNGRGNKILWLPRNVCNGS